MVADACIPSTSKERTGGILGFAGLGRKDEFCASSLRTWTPHTSIFLVWRETALRKEGAPSLQHVLHRKSRLATDTQEAEQAQIWEYVRWSCGASPNSFLQTAGLQPTRLFFSWKFIWNLSITVLLSNPHLGFFEREEQAAVEWQRWRE